MKKLFALILALSMALALVPAAFGEGNVLRYGTDAEPVGFDPHTISAVASMRMIGQIYNTLVDVDENLNVIPELATSWEQPDDQTYIFHLADNVTFHNGKPFTADDVVFSLADMLPKTHARARVILGKYLASVNKVDDLTALARRLQDENRSLRQQHESLAGERAALLAKNEQARTRVEAMIARLKSLEQHT